MSPRVALAVVSLSWLAACGASPSAPAAPAPLECTLVLLKTGPRTEPMSAEERSKMFNGHFANIQRLARERHLLVAGPFGKTKSDAALRGLFVLDTNDVARAKTLAESDPGFAAGVFQFEFHTLSTVAALRAQLDVELAAMDANAPPGANIRGYVLLTADDGASAFAALAGHASVLMAARLDGTKALVLLDAADIAAANALLAPMATKLGAFRLDEWSASKLLVDLPKRARA
jgi:uncharacterized protein YciI